MMLYKAIPFAMAVAAGAFPALTAAHAGPGATGLALQQPNTQITQVDYYYPRDRYYGHGPYFGESPLAIPGKVAGAALGLVTGVLGGAFFEDPYYSYRYSRDPYPGYQYYEEQSYGRDSGQYRIDRYYADRYNDEQYAEDRYRDERYRDERYSSKGYYEGGYYGSSYENNPYVSYYGGSYDASGVAACEREFQSFDRYTGTYITYAGEEVFCPYLRP